MGGSITSWRRMRQGVMTCLPLGFFFYILLFSSSPEWSSSSQRDANPQHTLTGSGFRKLLEDQEKAKLYVNSTNSSLSQRLPSCIIIGVRKCGTRALLEFLNLHPDIVTAEDEMHFFNDDERYKQGVEFYRKHMPLSSPNQVTIEKTPGYFISRIAPSRVHRMNSTIKLIVLLRDPVTRTVSDYTQIYYNKMIKNETFEAFEDIVIDPFSGEVNTKYKAVQISLYHHHFRHWLDLFPRHQIHVVDGDRLITDPVSEIEQIEDFLNLPHRVNYDMLYFNATRGFYCMRMNATYERCLGRNKGRKHPDIDPFVLHKLDTFFESHNHRLFKLIHQKLPWL